MSSGACRALVSLLLTLTATFVLVLPVAAADDRLSETSTVKYTVDPRSGDIDVHIVVRLTNDGVSPVALNAWGPLYVERHVVPNVPGFKHRFEPLLRGGPWRALYVRGAGNDAKIRLSPGEDEVFEVRYTIEAATSEDPTVPARVDRGYAYVCVPGQPTDRGTTKIEIESGSAFTVDQTGTELIEDSAGNLISGDRFQTEPESIFTCIEATRSEQLVRDSFRDSDNRLVELQAWRGTSGWLGILSRVEDSLREIRGFLGQEIPGEGPVIIRQSPEQAKVGGYASSHNIPGIVQVDERGLSDDTHELAHAWFGTDIFTEQWLREGLAEWTTTSVLGESCAAVTDNRAGLELHDEAWQVLRPTSDPETIEETMADQQAAACGIVSAYVERMGRDQWLTQVVPSLLDAETKYAGVSGAGRASNTIVNYREFLDAVDERGLAPVAKAASDYAGDVTTLELDFAQNLLAEFDIPLDAFKLEERSRARLAYHQFLEDSGTLGAPFAVRNAMDDWDFTRAMDNMEKSREVVATLQEADEKVEGLGLMGFIRPDYEAARNDDELDAVVAEALLLADLASDLFEPLEELKSASPQGWGFPNAVEQAIDDKRFDDTLVAIVPALRVVEAVNAADGALPDTGIADRYRSLYEAAPNVRELEKLASDAESVERLAVRASAGLADLRTEVGEWQIPVAISELIAQGQLQTALSIVEDARAVVQAATDADTALPDADVRSGIREEFEAASSVEQMAELRRTTEIKRDEAQTVDVALRTLSRLVEEWQVPTVVTDPIEDRDFASAAVAAAAAQAWIVNADAANTALPQLGALASIQADFEGATTIEELLDGADLARQQGQAATAVAEAIALEEAPRDMLTTIGLIATDTQKPIDEALEAAISGDVAEALPLAQRAADLINNGATTGGLRLAGLVFVGVAIIGVLGLWLMLRREAGPPWARQTKPHWVDEDEKKTSRWRK